MFSIYYSRNENIWTINICIHCLVTGRASAYTQISVFTVTIYKQKKERKKIKCMILHFVSLHFIIKDMQSVDEMIPLVASR